MTQFTTELLNFLAQKQDIDEFFRTFRDLSELFRSWKLYDPDACGFQRILLLSVSDCRFAGKDYGPADDSCYGSRIFRCA